MIPHFTSPKILLSVYCENINHDSYRVQSNLVFFSSQNAREFRFYSNFHYYVNLDHKVQKSH